MAAPAPQPVMKDGPPMVEVKDIFFKAHSAINYFAEESEADAIKNHVAFQHFNRGLECSNKYGCLFLSFNNHFYILQAKDVLGSQESRSFDDLKKLEVSNDVLPVAPNIIALSIGEEYLAVDTVRGDSGWVVVFNLADFINQGGSCRPFCEIRCSSSASVRVSGVCWNPGENMTNMIAINSEDGALYLAKINGPGNVELSRLAEANIRSLCWSPKGKQLVVGRTNGALSQLKLDLTVAKHIPGPEPGCVPVAILWTATTQFLVVFHRQEVGVDFMQLDLAKAAPPTYTNSGDIFISEAVPDKSSCFFLPFVPWNVVLAMTNSSSDVVVLVKEIQNQAEVWVPTDIADNRRAAFRLDNYARGAAVFYGSENAVVFSDTETYPSMPVVFMLGQRGSLSVYSIVNIAPEAVSLSVKVSQAIPDSVFSTSTAAAVRQPPPPQYSSPQTGQSAPAPPTSQVTGQPASFLQDSKPSPLPASGTFSFGGQGQIPSFQSAPPPFSQHPSMFKSTPPTSAPAPVQQVQFQSPQQQQHQQQPQPTSFLSQQPKSQTQSPRMFSVPQQQQTLSKSGASDAGQQQVADLRQLGTSTLPTGMDLAGLEKAVEEKRREMTTQLQKGTTGVVPLKGLEDDNQCAFVISELRKFEQRLANFREKMGAGRDTLNQLLRVSFTSLEQSVLTNLNSVEDFNSDMVSTTSTQKEEVEVLKERILNHFSQLEYAKSLVERSRDPRYLEHLRSRPLDPASQQKFDDILKLHKYIKNQISECRRYFYEQNRKRDLPLDRAPSTQLIYMTLSNHSKIIRRLKGELDNIKDRLGLGKSTNAYDEAEFLAVCEASYTGEKKKSSTLPRQNNDQDEITLNDLTAGISKVKLNRDSSRPDRKPINFSSRKLLILSKSMPEVSVVKVKAEETAWTRTTARPKKPKLIASYPTVESSSRATEPARKPEPNRQSDATPASFGSTFVVNSGSSASPSTSGPTNSAVAFGNISSMLDSSKTSTINFQGKTVENVAANPPKPSFTSSPSMAAKSNTQLSNMTFGNIGNTGSASPTMQNLPTLAGLLSTPPAAITPVTILPTSKPGAAFAAAPTSSGLPTVNLSFGGGLPSNKSMFGAGMFASGDKIFQGLGDTAAAKTAASTTPVQDKSSTPPASNLTPRAIATPSPRVPTPTDATISSQATATGVKSILAEQLSMTPVTGTSSSTSGSSSVGATGVETPKSVPSIPAVSFAASTAIAASMGKPSPTSTSLFSAPGISSTTPVSSSPFSALNLSMSDASNKSPNVSAATGAGASGGLFSRLTFGSPASSGGASSIFGQIAKTATVTPTTPSTTSVAPSTETTPVTSLSVTTEKPKTSESIISSTTSPTPATTAASTAPATGTTFGFAAATPGTTPVSSSITGGLFSASFAPNTTASSIFGAGTSPFAPASTAGAGILGSAPTTSAPTTVTSPGTTSIFGAPPATTAGSLFSIPASQPSAAGGLFSSTITTTSSSIPTGAATITTTAVPFGSPAPGFFSQPAPSGTTPSTGGLMSGLSISDPNKTATPASTAPGNIFSTSTFGGATPSAGSIFGGAGNAFSSQVSTAAALQTATSTGIFGSPAATTASVFGGAPAFGSASPFGSSFGGAANTPAFGGGGSVFGSSGTAASTGQSAGFGALAQQAAPSPFGGSPFGSGGQQQQASVFGTPAQQKPAGGLFSSTFGSPAATTAGSIFGGGASGFGTAPSGGAFSSGTTAGGVAQQGFGFGQSKPAAATGSVFGSPTPATAAPVFGGGATFGSASPFGSSFAPAPASTFGSTGGSVFGGAAAAQPNIGFGALAQQTGTSPGFGTTAFGGAPQQQLTASLFGSPVAQPQQQQQKPTFGGNAFSSWR